MKSMSKRCLHSIIMALFQIAKIRNPPKCPLMDEWTQKCGLSQASVVYTCNPNYLGS
jgi:hypothetical protein